MCGKERLLPGTLLGPPCDPFSGEVLAVCRTNGYRVSFRQESVRKPTVADSDPVECSLTFTIRRPTKYRVFHPVEFSVLFAPMYLPR